MLKKVLKQTSVARAVAVSIVMSVCSSVYKRALVKPIVFGGVAVSFPILVMESVDAQYQARWIFPPCRYMHRCKGISLR